MRPHDIVILLKIAAKGKKPWLMKDLAHELNISSSEISESLNRSVVAGLISGDKKRLMKFSIIDFLQHGLPYVYPQLPGPMVRGVPTAYAAPPLSKQIVSEEKVVWPYGEGTIRGQAIEPLHPSVPLACLRDKTLYKLLALTDALRMGKAREKRIAVDELNKLIN